ALSPGRWPRRLCRRRRRPRCPCRRRACRGCRCGPARGHPPAEPEPASQVVSRFGLDSWCIEWDADAEHEPAVLTTTDRERTAQLADALLDAAQAEVRHARADR